MTGSRPKPYDVAVVGYGPTGLTLCTLLGKAGHNVVAIERWPNLYHLPRAGHIDDEIMRIFQRIGIATKIENESAVPMRTVLVGSDGKQLKVTEAAPPRCGWQAHYSLYQPFMERCLDEEVRKCRNVEVLQGWKAERISQSSDGVEIQIRNFASNGDSTLLERRNETIRAKYLVGADGANSVVLAQGGFTMTDLGYRERVLVVFAERLDPDVGKDMPDIEFVMLPQRPHVAFRESGKRFARWEFLLLEAETTEEMSTPEVAWKLIGPWGFTPQNAKLIRHSTFEFRSCVADTWRNGRMFLAGDAAHLMPPFQGQGMCSGIRDAVTLAWKLDLVISGMSSPDLLDSYTRERKPNAVSVIESSVNSGRRFWVTDPRQAEKRDAAIRAPGSPSGFDHVPGLTDGILFRDGSGLLPPAGERAPQWLVEHQGEVVRFDDAVGYGWVILAGDETLISDFDESERDVVRRIKGRTALISRHKEDGLVDVDGKYQKWFQEIGCSLVVVRPDFYLFGGASSTRERRKLLLSLRTQLLFADTYRGTEIPRSHDLVSTKS